MRQLKKTLLALLCVGALFGMTACGDNRVTEQGTVNDATDENNTEKNHADRKGTEDDGVLEDVGRGIDHGVRDVVDGVDDAVDDATDGNRTNQNSANNHTNATNNGKAGQ